jgi:hypothetical protein
VGAALADDNDYKMNQERKRKRFLVKQIHVGAICEQAKAFSEASKRCLADFRDGVVPGPVVPGVVCGAFSLELWFKALYCAANPDGEVPIGHDLFALFIKLPEEIQTALIDRSAYPPPRFRDALLEDAKVFETWRYSYEHATGEPPPADGLEVLTVHLLTHNVLPAACEQVYGEFYA